VAVIIPTLNEEAFIGAVLDTIARQMPNEVCEILVVDGGSTDRTREIVAERGKADARIRLMDNEARLQSAAVNLGAGLAHPDVSLLIRADAHAEYPPDFVARLVEAHDLTGAQSVVNRLHTVGSGCFQRAVAAVSNSRIGTGGAAHRSGGQSGFIDHGHHALFDREWFRRVGGYDETFVANEDAEFDTRLRAAGGLIWFASESAIRYFPRSTPAALARQYYRYGRGRAQTWRRHGEKLRARQVVPAALVVVFGATAVVAPFWPWALFAPAAYLAGVSASAMALTAQSSDPCVLGSALALPVMHLAWGAGFIREVAVPPGSRIARRNSAEAQAEI
jgi:succinoglycan biosynthesis protein ExoA